MRPTFAVLELFCGIGGCSAALGDRATVTAAVDVNTKALEVYRANFEHPARARSLESLDARDLARWRADLWWLSPPCQPFTRRGLKRDDQDPRSAALLALLPRIDAERPPYLALENVPGFAGSRTHARLLGTLERAGYTIRQHEICPTELGIPNRRKRYYLLATRESLSEPSRAAHELRLAKVIDDRQAPHLQLAPEIANAYSGALDVVDPDDDAAVTACFTAAYGRSYVRSGSYLAWQNGLRRFSPQEVLRLLTFPERFSFPTETPDRLGWRLAGASLSVAVVRQLLSAIPSLARKAA